MELGFTGTSRGWTTKQGETVKWILKRLRKIEPIDIVHHGDCVGSDAQMHKLCTDLRIELGIHPPINPKARAFCDANPPNTLYLPKEYLARNKDIVILGLDGIIATPKTNVEPASLRGQGTWTTIGYARKAKRNIWLVFPDGSYEFEGDKQMDLLR